MITEIRHIIFSNDELKLVFQSVPVDGFDRTRRITRIQVVEGPPPSIRIQSEAAQRPGRAHEHHGHRHVEPLACPARAGTSRPRPLRRAR